MLRHSLSITQRGYDSGQGEMFDLAGATRIISEGNWIQVDATVAVAGYPSQVIKPPVLEVLDNNGRELEEFAMAWAGDSQATVTTKLAGSARKLRLRFRDRNIGLKIERATVRAVGRIEATLRLVLPKITPAMREPRHGLHVARKIWDIWNHSGVAGLKARLREEVRRRTEIDPYLDWVDLYDTITDEDRRQIRERIAKLTYKPKFSIVMPVYNIDEAWLRRAMDSVLNQLYENWEFCIADDNSPKPHVRRVLEEYMQRDPRVKVVFRKENGHIAAATASALELATGDFVGLLDHDDELREHTLYMVLEELNRHPETDLIYTDEDKIDTNGRRFHPNFKSDWNQDLFYAQNLITHFAVFRASILKEIGGFRPGYDGSQDYDLMLRFVEKTTPSRIRHIPFILYHWRAIPGSVALASGEKDYAHVAARKAIQSHLDRIGVDAKCVQGHGPIHRVIYPLPEPQPKVSVIVCTRDSLTLLKDTVEGVLHKTAYDSIELLIVDNQSVEPETLKYFETVSRDPRVRILKYDAPFDFGAMNNFAARESTGEILLFLNNDIQVFKQDWLREMASHALRPEVGAVGAMLYYPNDLIQHGGVLLGVGGVAEHAHKGTPRGNPGFIGRAFSIQRFSAVTGACMAVRRKLFLDAGGFDSNLPVAYNDIDLCLTLDQKGFRSVWTPFAELYHMESATRGHDNTPERIARLNRESEYFLKKWGEKAKNDPYYNPNFDNSRPEFKLAFPPRVTKPWTTEKN